MMSAFGVEHAYVSKALPHDENYYRVHEGRKDRLAFTQQPDWMKGERHLQWVNGVKTAETLGNGAAVRNEYRRRTDSKSARLLGSYRNRMVRTNPHSSMGRGSHMAFSEYRPILSRKRVYVAAGAAAVGGAAAVKHHRDKP